MAIGKCRGCDVDLDDTTDSEAHIIPNALGGRLKPSGIICRTCNTTLDNIADNALIEAFGSWPTLLDIPRDRGSNPPRQVETDTGSRVRLERDGTMMATDVIYDVTPITDGHLLEIAAGNMKVFRQLLNRAAKEYPQLDVKEAERHAKTLCLPDTEKLKLRIDFSPEAVFGGVATAIWLFLIMETGRAFSSWDRLLTTIKAVQEHSGTFRYFIEGMPGLEGPDIPLGHKIVIRSVPATGELIAYVEILGILKIGGIYASAGGPSILVEHIYAYDLTKKIDRSNEFSIHPSKFECQNWKTVGLDITSAEKLREHFVAAAETVFGNHYRSRFNTKN